MKYEKEIINKWIDEAYDNACKHNFHHGHLPDSIYLMLIITEVAEAVEAERKGKEADRYGFKVAMDNAHNGIIRDDWFDDCFRKCIKDSIEDEIADIIIRSCDYLGMKGYHLEKDIETDPERMTEFDSVGSAGYEWCCVLTELPSRELFEDLFPRIFHFCERQGIPIVQHVEWKMRFNRGRPLMHGGKAY